MKIVKVSYTRVKILTYSKGYLRSFYSKSMYVYIMKLVYSLNIKTTYVKTFPDYSFQKVRLCVNVSKYRAEESFE